MKLLSLLDSIDSLCTDKQTDTQTHKQTDLAVELTSPFGWGQVKRAYKSIVIIDPIIVDIIFERIPNYDS